MPSLDPAHKPSYRSSSINIVVASEVVWNSFCCQPVFAPQHFAAIAVEVILQARFHGSGNGRPIPLGEHLKRGGFDIVRFSFSMSGNKYQGRAFRESAHFERIVASRRSGRWVVGSGRVGPDDPTQSVIFEKFLIRPDHPLVLARNKGSFFMEGTCQVVVQV